MESIDCNRINFRSNDRQKIQWVEGFLKDAAANWHQERRLQLDRLGMNDAWDAYSQAYQLQYRDTNEIQHTISLMRDLPYKGDIQGYLDQMRLWKFRVQDLSTHEWQRLLKTNLGDEMFGRLSFGEVPQDDAGFEQRLLDVGKGLEEAIVEGKLYGLKAPYLFANRHPGGEKKEKKRDEYTPPSKKATPDSGSKKERKPERSALKGSRPSAPSDEKKRVKFDFKEAHEGVPQELIDKRREKKNCTACGYENHDWKHCLHQKPKLTGVINKPPGQGKAAAAKRKREEADEQGRPEEKKSKTASLTVRGEKLMEETPSRIFEVDSDGDLDIADWQEDF